MNKKLILISGSPCVGKTSVGTRLFESYNNSAYLDGDCRLVRSGRSSRLVIRRWIISGVPG